MPARRGSPSGHATRWIGRSAGDVKFLAAFGCVVLTSSDGALDPPTSSSPRDESVRRRTRDCSIHPNKLHSLLVGSEDELSRAPLQLTCVVDDQRQTDHRSKSNSGAGGETRSDPGRIRADQKDSGPRTEFYRARNLFGDVE